MNFDEICKFLKEKGFISVSVEGHNKQIFLSEDRSLSIMVEERRENMTAEDEKKIQKRLKALGYL